MRYFAAVAMAGMVLLLSNESFSREQDEEQPQDKAVASDLAKLHGKWELTRRVGNRTLRSVKVIEGNKTRLQRFDENGEVYWAHTSSFEIEITDKVRVFTFFNLEVTAGPSKGGKSNKRSSHIYRVVDGNLVEAHGLLVGQEETEPRIVVWKRVNDEIAAVIPASTSFPREFETQ